MHIYRCFELFRIVHSLVDDADAVKLVAREVVRDFAEDGVVYLELRTTLKAIPSAGMTEEDYLGAVVEGIQEACRDDDTQIQVRCVCASTILLCTCELYLRTVCILTHCYPIAVKCH